MWAGSDFEFHSPIRVGDAIERTSTIVDFSEKSGRTGRRVFVKVRHGVRRQGEPSVALNEHHNIVYRDLPSPNDVVPPPLAAPKGATWSRDVVADDVLLFRYSALTFNGHRTVSYTHLDVYKRQGTSG